MKAEYIQAGKNWDYVNPTNETIAAGTVIIIGNVAAVAAADIPPGETGAVATTGIWALPKDNSVIAAGDKVFYDSENDVATIPAAVQPKAEASDSSTTETETDSPVFLGIASAAAPKDAGVVAIRLNG